MVVVALCGLAVAAIGTAAAFGALGRSQAEPTTTTVSAGQSPIGLHGVVGPGFTISFAFSDNNQTVASLNPGTYKITIDDLANNHNFHLTGAGTDLSTTVPDIGTTVWTATLQPGTYMFVCDPHASTMSGQLLVMPYGTVTSFPAPAQPAKKASHRKKH